VSTSLLQKSFWEPLAELNEHRNGVEVVKCVFRSVNGVCVCVFVCVMC